MSQIHQSRKSENPYIDTIWQSTNVSDGVYLATPDGSWDLIVMIDSKGSKRMMMTGQATHPMSVPYTAGSGSVVISFAAGVYMPLYPARQLVDSFKMLPNSDSQHFTIAGNTFPFPTFENAEELVEAMIDLKLLRQDGVVMGELGNNPKALSERAKQRRFVHTTGVTSKYIHQIKRAQEAVKLMKQGKKPIDAAAESGFVDQPHMAKSLRKIMDSKPSQIDEIHKL